MTTTPKEVNQLLNQKKLNESNFGFIHYSSSLSHYIESDFNIAMEVFTILENRYFYGDWGIVESDSIKFNNEAIKNENGGDILGAYILSTGKKIWIKTVGYGLTEDKMDLENYSKMDYNNTCIMFPEDY